MRHWGLARYANDVPGSRQVRPFDAQVRKDMWPCNVYAGQHIYLTLPCLTSYLG
jgi:hypothetical protein